MPTSSPLLCFILPDPQGGSCQSSQEVTRSVLSQPSRWFLMQQWKLSVDAKGVGYFFRNEVFVEGSFSILSTFPRGTWRLDRDAWLSREVSRNNL